MVGFTFFLLFSSCFLGWAGVEVVLPPPWAFSYVVWTISISGFVGFGWEVGFLSFRS